MKLRTILKAILKWTGRLLAVVLVVGFVIVFVAYWRSTNDCDRKTAPPANPMKAVVYCDYGAANLRLAEVDKPVPNDDQVLIKVRAAAINPYDWHFIEGTPKIMRLGVGLRKPKVTRIGGDVAGQIEAVGRNVTQFKPGDEVFGICSGSLAQYCLGRSRLSIKPANLTFEQAASVPVAGITALQGLRDEGKIQVGQRVLINGASGGVGTFAVQIAKSFDTEVVGVCSTRNVDLVRSLGADDVIDYTKADFTATGPRYDVIIDNVGNQPLLRLRRGLRKRGKLVMIGGGGVNDQGLVGPMTRPLKAMLLSPFMKQKMSMFMADVNKNDLAFLADLMQSGKVKPVIDRTYDSLSKVPEAIAYLEQGHARGKVVVRVD